jgi:hypothetical protein
MAYSSNPRPVAATTATTVGANMTYICSSSPTMTLKAAADSAYHEFNFVNVSGTTTITPAGTNTIQGVNSSITLTLPYESVTLKENGLGTGWVII